MVGWLVRAEIYPCHATTSVPLKIIPQINGSDRQSRGGMGGRKELSKKKTATANGIIRIKHQKSRVDLLGLPFFGGGAQKSHSNGLQLGMGFLGFPFFFWCQKQELKQHNQNLSSLHVDSSLIAHMSTYFHSGI